MTEDTKKFVWFIAFPLIITVAACLWGGYCENERWQRETVEIGKAEYYLDAEHNKQWRWKP